MKTIKIVSLTFTSATCTLVFLGYPVKLARAGILHDGWNYAIDSFNDSTGRPAVGADGVVGGTIFEIYGLAMKDNLENDTVSFAINANLPQNGAVVPYLTDYGHTGWGDLFLDTSDGRYGIRFTTDNESGVVSTGIYRDITTKSVATANDGWSTNTNYTNFVLSKGGNPSLGDLAQSSSPIGDSTDNVIASGTKIGDLLAADFTGLDFSRFGTSGVHTFGFSLSKSLLPTGDVTAWLFAECFNDGIALQGNLALAPVPPPIQPPLPPYPPITPKPVPEPTSLLGIFVVAAFGKVLARKRSIA